MHITIVTSPVLHLFESALFLSQGSNIADAADDQFTGHVGEDQE